MRGARVVIQALFVAALLACAVLLSLAGRIETPTGLAALKVPPGFRVELVAGPDLVSYPMMGTFDDRGRLFLCESSGNTLNDQKMASHPDYQIRVLEDGNGDGIFDRSQVFAEGLTLPAGAVWYRNSLYVASPPDLLRFDDPKGSGRADRKQSVVTGWTMSSNAASLHGPFLGPDGWLYLTDGRHGFDIKTKDGRAYRGLGSRIWRVRPDGTGLEWLAGGGFDNPVELIFTPAGETIGTMTYFRDPENGERDALLHYVEGGVYPKWYPVVSEFKRTGDLMPVMTKFARIAPSGLVRYRGTAFGRAYQGNLFSAQFNPHRVQRHILYREGASFRTEDSDFLTSRDPDFHPTDVIEDADGSLLVVDTGAWFIHGCPISRVAKPEIKGAVYRIRKIGTPPVADARGASIHMESMGTGAVAKLLEDSRPVVRDRAVEFLVEAGGSAAAAALSGLRKSSPFYESRAAAVFALYRIGTEDAKEAVRAALSDADFRVRMAAARCAGMSADANAVEQLMAMARSEHPAARRQAIAALGQIGDRRAVAALLAAAANPEDRFVEHSVIYSLIVLNQPGALQQALAAPQSKVRKAALIALDQLDRSPLAARDLPPLLRASDKELRSAALWVVSHHSEWAGVVMNYLSERLLDPSLTSTEQDAVRDALVAFSGNAEAQQLVGKTLSRAGAGEKQILFLLDTMDASSVREFPAVWLEALGPLLSNASPNVRIRTVDLIRSRSLAGFDRELDAIAADAKALAQLRMGAVSVLEGRDPRFSGARLAFLLASLEKKTEAVLRQSAARVIGRSTPDHDQLMLIANQHLAHADPLVLPALLECFRSSHDADVGEAIIKALRASPVAPGTLGEDRLRALLAGYPDRVQQLSRPLFEQLGNAQKERIDRLRKLAPLLTAGGDLGRGRRLFFGEKVACSGCHTIGAEGGHVGPDLTGIGAIRSGHDLLEAIVFPSASFVPGYEIYNVETARDRLSGVIRSQSSNAVVLVTGPGEEVRIARGTIRSMQRSDVSLMPDGFDAILNKSELTDLLAFLQAEKTRPQP